MVNGYYHRMSAWIETVVSAKLGQGMEIGHHSPALASYQGTAFVNLKHGTRDSLVQRLRKYQTGKMIAGPRLLPHLRSTGCLYKAFQVIVLIVPYFF